MCFVFFFKQKTAYEMRISDWSSDVCSSDLVVLVGQDPLLFMLAASPLPEHISEIEFMGGLRGQPVNVIRGPYTGFPIPADAEIEIGSASCRERGCQEV